MLKNLVPETHKVSWACVTLLCASFVSETCT